MAGETATETTAESDVSIAWRAGIVGGVIGGIVFGAMIQMTMRPILAAAIPALWGLSGLGAGWVVHLVDAAIFGLVFAAIVESTGLGAYAASRRTGWLVGGVWGIVLWLLAAGIVMPIWLSAVGFPMAPPLPNLNPQTLPGHVGYGLVLGLVYPYVRRS